LKVKAGQVAIFVNVPLTFPQISQRGHIIMYRYELIVFWSDEDARFVVEVPELSGCMADGETYEQAVQNAQVVIAEWIETAQSIGREIPQPRGRLAYA
jgi:predicted RNase H-like HicB family nuclease